MKYSHLYYTRHDKQPLIIVKCQQQESEISLCKKVNSTERSWSGIRFVLSTLPLSPLADHIAAAGRIVAGYTEQQPMHLSVRKRKISAEDMAECFAEGRYLYSGEFNLRVVNCMARKKAQIFEVDGAEVEELGTNEG